MNQKNCFKKKKKIMKFLINNINKLSLNLIIYHFCNNNMNKKSKNSLKKIIR